MTQIVKIPTLAEILDDSPERQKQNDLIVLLNQPPHKAWLKANPLANGEMYLPIERMEYLMSRIFGSWETDIIYPPQLIANSVVMVVKVTVTNPVTGVKEYQTGVGAVGIQTEKGAAAMDISKIKGNGVMLAAPAAAAFAWKNACQKWGKFLGKDLGRSEDIAYESMLKPKTTIDELKALYESKKSMFDEKQRAHFERILQNNETASFEKMRTALNATGNNA